MAVVVTSSSPIKRGRVILPVGWKDSPENPIKGVLTGVSRSLEMPSFLNASSNNMSVELPVSTWICHSSELATSNVTTKAPLCGVWTPWRSSPVKIDDMMKTVLITLDPRIDDFLPILSPFFSKQRKRSMQVREEQIRTILPFIEKRRSLLKNNPETSFAYLDTLFDLEIEGRKSRPTDTELVSLCSEFLNGGTDTTATALEWGIARLIENPEIQSKLYTEIKSKVGDRKVDEKDAEEMVYLNAVVKELLRKHPPTYFALTHAVTQPATLGGYDVPTDANVEIFLPAIAEDPSIWSEPEKFNPDRFATGKEDADITGVKGVKMLPFGGGRRICPGLGLGTVHVNLLLARMVQEFEWSLHPSQQKVDLSEKLEFTVVMKKPLRAVVKPRI
ncbi:PREDICTED: cytochrome P450 77A2-like [Nelumbo nucifera]|uniref:Cytochrome P450 77A2-like n=1 Tax=Nelumbo nucifera TaxID=4432 RepID=A0A1U7Z587_NELNU|nr:PREDICTED: cytochrome P450 77A2-like [Nelumbo nucifera]